jgi:hypothetical protein
MIATTMASSVSQFVLNLPEISVVQGRLLSKHQHACNIELTTNQVIALVDESIGNGPLNIVLNDVSIVHALDKEDHEISISESHLRFGAFDISLVNAEVWDPRPDWQQLRHSYRLPVGGLEKMLMLARQHAPPGTMLDLLQPVAKQPRTRKFEQSLFAELSSILQDMQTEKISPQGGAAALAGLGNGLTPAGDDFLLGIMLFAWLRSDSAIEICQPLAAAAEQRTTRLSACLLKQAAIGNCSEAWHSLFESFEQNVAALMSCGHTSGGDSLAGFIWAGQHEHLIK